MRYFAAQSPLVDWIDTLADHVAGEQFDLVVIDSVGMALGGDAGSDEKVLAFMTALRTLQTTVLLIDHMTKGADSEDRGAFGSAYKKTRGGLCGRCGRRRTGSSQWGSTIARPI